MKSAVLYIAFLWKCPTCSMMNWIQPTDPDLTDEQRETAYRHLNDLEDWQELPDDWREFQLVTTPSIVACRKCHNQAEVKTSSAEGS